MLELAKHQGQDLVAQAQQAELAVCTSSLSACQLVRAKPVLLAHRGQTHLPAIWSAPAALLAPATAAKLVRSEPPARGSSMHMLHMLSRLTGKSAPFFWPVLPHPQPHSTAPTAPTGAQDGEVIACPLTGRRALKARAPLSSAQEWAVSGPAFRSLHHSAPASRCVTVSTQLWLEGQAHCSG